MPGKYTSTYEKHAAMRLRRYSLSLLAICSLLLLSACLKNKDNNDVNIVSALSVVHASASAPAIDFVLDRQKVNNQAFEYGDRIHYFGVYSGRWNAAFYEENSYSQPLLETSIQVQNGLYYTLFFIGDEETPEGLLLEDDISKPDSNKATLRFVNLSTHAGSVDFFWGEETLASQKAYKEYTSFQIIDAGKQTVEISAKQGTITRNFNFREGHVYTIWLKDVLESADTQIQAPLLDMELIDHVRDLEAQQGADVL